MSNPIQDVLGDDYKPIKGSDIATVKGGRLAYIDLDINKPGKFFFDLTDVFNATVGEAEKEMSLRILRNGQRLPLNNYKVQADGQYPNGEDWHVTGANLQSNSPVTTFTFPLGLFQEVGEYPFQFTITNTQTGDKETSHWCLFNVTQSATTLGIDWANGVNPFDSDYTKWKQEVIQYHQQEIDYLTSLNESASKIQQQLDGVDANINGAIDTGWQKKLDSENTWTGKQHFNEGLTASTVSANTLQGDNLSVDSSASLPGNTILNNDILKYENGSLAQGLFPCEGYWIATSNGKSVASSLMNGVTGYISCKKFHYTPRDGDIEWGLMEIHMNCNIPTSAFGKPVVQFDSKNMDGVDQTPFIMGGHIFQIDTSTSTLKCNGYANGYNSTTAMDASMI